MNVDCCCLWISLIDLLARLFFLGGVKEQLTANVMLYNAGVNSMPVSIDRSGMFGEISRIVQAFLTANIDLTIGREKQSGAIKCRACG